MKSNNSCSPLTSSETVKLFIAAIDFYINSSKPWEVETLTPLLTSGAFTEEESMLLTAQIEKAKREYKSVLLREQLTKILVGEDMVKGAKDHISRMGAPKPPPAAAQQSFNSMTNMVPYEIEEMVRKKYEQYEQRKYQNQAQALGSGYGSALNSIKNPWNP